jgi:antitoxin component YwqK of YwqJK toxin-antitoxin module
MNKQLTFLLSLTFLFLVGCSGNDEEPEVKKKFYDNGKLLSEVQIKNGKEEGLGTWWYESGKRNLKPIGRKGTQKTGNQVV